ncbi:glutathione S-transferase family protein [Rhodospirillaceae bacterium SYSU D60014]|uniref:glutathione S-transferase family protein n=1 Tax=Virgifigura deserti TaxID=2268457 RepID=UPI0013C52877
MYRLYWSPGSAAMAPHAVLEEIGAPYILERIDLSPGVPRSPDYLKLNPNGKVPTLVVDGVVDESQVIYESAAICMYLADRHPEARLAPAVDDPLRGAYYQWMAYLASTLQPAYLLYYYPERHTIDEAQTPAIQARATDELMIIWDRINQALAAGPYLLGERFSACDIYMQMLATWQDPVPQLYARCHNVKRCVGLVGARPAIHRMLVQHDAAA